MLAQYPKVRKTVYAIFAVIGLLLTSYQVAIVSLHVIQPDWLTAALAVFAFVGVQIGFTASSNTPAIVAQVVEAPAKPE